ncbi:ATP-binding protein [Rhodovarius sp.]|uniref:ATP-binding protein n=1 Tax=Rhodovarius sp. TaxID=2972673 RepID=UPI0034A5CA87
MSELQHARIAELCGELRLGAVPDLYGATAQAAAARDASFSDFLEDTLRAEREVRRSRARDMLARTAGFPAIKTLDGYDFGFATGAPRQQIQELASLAFVERAENVVLLGGLLPVFLASLREAFPAIDWDKAYKEFQAAGEATSPVVPGGKAG